VLADPLAGIAAPGFADPSHQALFGAWHSALAYSLQLYFDFSGYSDMAIGLARMFNITFPQNFNSPYKAACVIEYWQRWHMTLTRYLNLYLYNPVALAVTRRRVARGQGVNRKALATPDGFAMLTVLPTMFTMLLAGIWHGAGFQFLVFGLLHGFYLVVNHAWRILGPSRPEGGDTAFAHAGKVGLTYLCVLVGAVFFRASSCGSALDLLGGMIGAHGIGSKVVSLHGVARDLGELVCLYGIVWLLPNTQEIMRAYEPVLRRIPAGPFPLVIWQPTWRWAMVTGIGATLGVLAIGGTTEFLYFQF
jgi:D-alanyl-lipoteichoic acid acyltransferase DltB (MBOAT superfamily)